MREVHYPSLAFTTKYLETLQVHGKRNFCVPVLVVTSLSTSTVQDIYFLANNDVHYNLSGEHSLRTVSNLPGTVSMITLNYEQNYNKPH